MNYRKIDYAKKKGVTPARISALVRENRLVITKELNIDVIVDCKQNDALFNCPAHNRTSKSE